MRVNIELHTAFAHEIEDLKKEIEKDKDEHIRILNSLHAKHAQEIEELKGNNKDRKRKFEDESINIYLLLSKHNSLILSVSFSKDGKMIATGSEDKTARITDLTTGDTIHTI